ncbi:MAG: capsular polysaccharide synthesis protein [Treponema sp.]|nr:capsular polysaccharide synthesis protein [Treponema sp.]
MNSKGIYYYTSRILILIRRIIPQCRIYGFSVSFWSFLFGFNRLWSSRIALLISKNKHKSILKYLYYQYSGIINDYIKIKPEQTGTIGPDSTIWVCWWDGDESMPPIVKACFESIKINASTHPVKLITKHNYSEFVSFPPHIIEKLNKKIITITHFSNILRMNLLFEHGGIWIDATVLAFNCISFNNLPFFSLNTLTSSYNIYHSRWQGSSFNLLNYETDAIFGINRWSASFLAGSKNILLFKFIKDFLYSYWSDHDDLIDYPLVDYVFALACMYVPEFNALINSVAPLNYNKFELEDKLNLPYSEEDFLQYTARPYYKLTYKMNLKPLTKDRKLSLYGYLLNKYNIQ